MTLLHKDLRRFLHNERGTVLTEAVMVMPLLVWAYLGLFTYWDAYRSLNVAQKASYTTADMISRFDSIDPATFFPGLQRVLEYMIDDNESVALRVTGVTWAESRKRYEVQWSRSPGNKKVQLTTTTLQTMASKIPTMADGDQVVLVETWIDYVPVMNIDALPFSNGLKEQTFYQFIATRPRPPKTCLTTMTCS